MQGLILAAGRGKRMNELTNENPKCLVQLKGKPLLFYQIEALQKSGIHKIAVVCGYQQERIVDGRITQKFINPQWATSNMVRTMLQAYTWLEQDVTVISYSDIFYDSSAVTALCATTDDIAITYDINFLELWSKRLANPLADLETFRINEKGYLLEIGDRARSLDEIQGQYMGLLKFTPAGWKKIFASLQKLDDQVVDRLDMTSLLKLLLQQDIAIKAAPFSGVWGEVDQPSDLQLYESSTLSSERSEG